MMNLKDKLLQSLLPGKVLAVQVGVTRAAVLVETEDGIRCGLAATLSNPELDHNSRPPVMNAGYLHGMRCVELAGLIESPSFTEASVGLATINALLPKCPTLWTDLKAEDYLVERGVNKNIVIVGHFPFVNWLKPFAKHLWILELKPQDGDLPAQAAPEVIPQADLVAITATTLINKTFQGLIELCRPDAKVVLMGPSTPLSPTLFDYGIDILSGTIVTDPRAALIGVGQGISLRQLRHNGMIRYVSLHKEQPNGKQ